MTVEERSKALSDFKNEISLMTDEELENIEKVVTEESKALDIEVSAKEFKLETEGQAEAFAIITKFLNSQKLKWNYALGMLSVYEFYMKNQETISYALLDTTLRILGSIEYTGYDDWMGVKTIDTYFSSVAEEYREITDRIYTISEKYSYIDAEYQMRNPVKTAE